MEQKRRTGSEPKNRPPVVPVVRPIPRQQGNVALDLSLFEQRPNHSSQGGYHKSKTTVTKSQQESTVTGEQERTLVIPKEHFDKVQQQRRRGKNRRAVQGVLLAVGIAIVCMVMLFGQVRLSELTGSIEEQTKKLSEAESLYTQYQMRSDAGLSLSAIEEYAKDTLGMTKEEETQQVYIELSGQDKGQVLKEEGGNWLAAGWNYLVGLLS